MTTLDENRGEWTSASSAEADRLCPGRHQACANLPDLPPTPESTTGERIHAFLAGDKVELSVEEYDAATACLERLNGTLEKWRTA